MKSIILGLAIGLSTIALSQNDTLLSNVEAYWRFNNHLIDGVSGEWFGWQSDEVLINDSVMFDDKYWSSYHIVSLQLPSAYVNIDSGKVYAKLMDYDLIQDTSTTFLLYDFDLLVSDTAYYKYNGLDTTYIIVDEVNLALLGGFARKAFTLSNGELWFQGIGSDRGLLYPLHQETFFGSRVLCYYSGQYKDSMANSYLLELGDLSQCNASQEKEVVSQYTVLANSDYLTINSNSSLVLGTDYELYNMGGQLILKNQINDVQTQVNWQALQSGVYVILIAGHAQKIVKH